MITFCSEQMNTSFLNDVFRRTDQCDRAGGTTAEGGGKHRNAASVAKDISDTVLYNLNDLRGLSEPFCASVSSSVKWGH